MRYLTFAVLFLLMFCKADIYSQTNQENILKILLDIPAPPPVKKIEVDNSRETPKFSEEFFSKSKIPPDDAPIEQIMAYWKVQSGNTSNLSYLVKPTKVVAKRIFNEIRNQPSLLSNYINIIPADKEYIEFIKQYYDEQSASMAYSNDYETELKPPASVAEAISLANNIGQNRNYGNEDNEDNELAEYSLISIKKWLTLNSKYYIDELEKKSNSIKDKDDYVSNYMEEFVALAKLDWEKAEPIIERLLNNNKSQPASAATAMWAAYGHYMDKDDDLGASEYRRMLQEIVADKNAKPPVRDIALDALDMEGDFEGRDKWYISILGDETLFDLKGYTGLTTIITRSPPEKWIAPMLGLVGNKNSAVHQAAVRNLIILLGKTDDGNDKLILRALIPWLTNKSWAKENSYGSRRQIIEAYGRLEMSEAIPALINILQTEKPEPQSELNYGSNMANTSLGMGSGTANSNMMADDDVMTSDAMVSDGYSEELSDTQTAVIEALSKFKDPRAVPALINALNQVSGYTRNTIISAIINSGGYDANQQLSYLENLARKIASGTIKPDESEYDDHYDGYSEIEFPDLNDQIGLVVSGLSSPDDELVRLLINRIKSLKKSDPGTADVLNSFLQKWNSKVLDIERLNNVSDNSADIPTILQVLIERKDLREKYPNIIYAMRGKSGVAAGVAACLLEDENEVLSAINSSDKNTKIAAFACARLIRLELPIAGVGQSYFSSDPNIALAAERYLISEDSQQARQMVLSKYPNEALILGARLGFVPNKKLDFSKFPISEIFASVGSGTYFYNASFENLEKMEAGLRDEVKTDDKLIKIYGFLQDSTNGHKILRVYRDKAVYTWYEDDASFRERIVNQDELRLITEFVESQQIENQMPILEECHHSDCPIKEFVTLDAKGGRRVFIRSADLSKNILSGLEIIFNTLEQGKSKLKYHFENKLEGLEIIFDEKDLKAKSLWKNGDDFRVLVLNEKQQEKIEAEFAQRVNQIRESVTSGETEEPEGYYKRLMEAVAEIERQKGDRKFEPYKWRSVIGGKVAGEIQPPNEDFSTGSNIQFPQVAGLEQPENIRKARTPEFELRAGDRSRPGLFKVARNGLVSQVGTGFYADRVVVSGNGYWAVANKMDSEESMSGIYKINLRTGRETKINLPKTFAAVPIAFVPSLNKFLVYSMGFERFKDSPPYVVEQLERQFKNFDIKNKKPEYYLIDADTGKFELIKGEFAPLEQITLRNLQQTSNPDEFWAAIPEENGNSTGIGRYNPKNFTFSEVMRIPEIKLTSMDIWVDEANSKVYFIYEGNLLALPLKSGSSPTE